MSEKNHMQVRIGTSGYQYQHWRGLFYPPYMPSQAWLYHYGLAFDTVEINSSFYRLPERETFERWHTLSPPGFLFALKYFRIATHEKRLAEPARHLEEFVPRARRLKDKLGPVLVQLSPFWRVDHLRLAAFLDAAPRWIRWAFEFRHRSWFTERTYTLLRDHHAALCLHDMTPEHPEEVTADWVYLRYHGTPHSGNYPDAALRVEAGRVQAYARRGLDVYAYFNNDMGGHALTNALTLKQYLSLAAERAH